MEQKMIRVYRYACVPIYVYILYVHADRTNTYESNSAIDRSIRVHYPCIDVCVCVVCACWLVVCVCARACMQACMNMFTYTRV